MQQRDIASLHTRDVIDKKATSFRLVCSVFSVGNNEKWRTPNVDGLRTLEASTAAVRYCRTKLGSTRKPNTDRPETLRERA